MKTKRISKLLIAFALIIGLNACDLRETDYELAWVYLAGEEGCNFFSQGDVSICADNNFNLYNTGNEQVEFAFVKDLVYRLGMINKIPETGWTDTIKHINLEDGYVGRLLLDDGSYEYCRFFVYTIDYDINANQYLLFKYHSNFTTKK